MRDEEYREIYACFLFLFVFICEAKILRYASFRIFQQIFIYKYIFSNLLIYRKYILQIFLWSYKE